MQLYPFLFEPNLHFVVWGGNQLRPYKGLEPSDEPIGESWEVSAVPQVQASSVMGSKRVKTSYLLLTNSQRLFSVKYLGKFKIRGISHRKLERITGVGRDIIKKDIE